MPLASSLVLSAYKHLQPASTCIYQYVGLRIFLGFFTTPDHPISVHLHCVSFILPPFLHSFSFIVLFFIYKCLLSCCFFFSFFFLFFFSNSFLAGLTVCFCHQRTGILISDVLMIYLSSIDAHIHQQVAHGSRPEILGNKHLGLLCD